MTDRRKVLIVDDEPSVVQMLSALLETRGYQVDVANSGQQALSLANKKPDIILLDLILPDLEGFEVCRLLKREQATRHIPIIILSVRYLFEDKIEGLYLGADDYLTKPFDYEELFARIETVMRRRKFFDDYFAQKEPLILELRKIIKEELIKPFYQPIFLLDNLKVLGVEVLSRPPLNSILSNPETLFKVALDFGMYAELELMAWEKALKSLPVIPKDIKIFLNCNPYLIQSPEFYKVKAIFDQGPFKSQDIVLEITERSAIPDFKSFYDRLQFYRDYGFQVAIDDIGGGYASLESIVTTKPSVVKIDNHIVYNIKNDPFKLSIIKFIVSFCKENHVICVAEGIETKEDLDTLMGLGVDAGQGYLLCRPTPDLDFIRIYEDLHERLNIPVPKS